jgi:hypothetical protein
MDTHAVVSVHDSGLSRNTYLAVPAIRVHVVRPQRINLEIQIFTGTNTAQVLTVDTCTHGLLYCNLCAPLCISGNDKQNWPSPTTERSAVVPSLLHHHIDPPTCIVL